MMKMLKKNKKGFTLIELIVVIAILAILAAIAIPRFVGTQSTAKTRAHETNKSVLTSAAQVAVAENGAPATQVQWTGIGAATLNGAAIDSASIWWPAKFLDSWPSNPTGGNAYTVTIAATSGTVTVAP